MTSWQKILKNSITSPQELTDALNGNTQNIQKVAAKYPLRINPYYLNLIKKTGRPLYIQAVPDLQELNDKEGLVDP